MDVGAAAQGLDETGRNRKWDQDLRRASPGSPEAGEGMREAFYELRNLSKGLICFSWRIEKDWLNETCWLKITMILIDGDELIGNYLRRGPSNQVSHSCLIICTF